MKRFYNCLVLVCLLIVTSCQFSENIYINADGSGKMEFSFDGSQFMQTAGESMGETDEKVIDSTFSFKELFSLMSDSIATLPLEQQQKLKSLEPFNMHMLINYKASQMKFDMFTDFKTVGELQDMFKAMQDFGDLNGKGKANSSPFSSLGANNNTELAYSFNGKIFKRTATIKDKALQKQITDSLGQMAMMFGSSTYKLNYHFPKRIKKVSNDKALFSDDKKSVTIEYGFMEYIENPEALNLEIVLED